MQPSRPGFFTPQGAFKREDVLSVRQCLQPEILILFYLFFFNLTYSRWTSSLPSCLWSLRIFSSLPGSRLTIFYRDASSALLQLVNQWFSLLKPCILPAPKNARLGCGWENGRIDGKFRKHASKQGLMSIMLGRVCICMHYCNRRSPLAL